MSVPRASTRDEPPTQLNTHVREGPKYQGSPSIREDWGAGRATQLHCVTMPAQQGGSTLNWKGTHVNKQELIDVVAKTADISKAAAGRAVDGAITAIKGSLKKGQTVTLVGFGTFYVGKRAARSGRNPRTGASIKIRAAKVPKFRAGKALKDSVN